MQGGNKPDPAVHPRQTSKHARSHVTASSVPLIKYTPLSASSCDNQHATSHIGVKRFVLAIGGWIGIVQL